MSTTRPTIDQSLIDKISAIKPKYVTTNGFIHMLLEDAYNDRVNKKVNLTNNIDYIYTNNKELENKELLRKIYGFRYFKHYHNNEWIEIVDEYIEKKRNRNNGFFLF